MATLKPGWFQHATSIYRELLSLRSMHPLVKLGVGGSGLGVVKALLDPKVPWPRAFCLKANYIMSA